MTTPQIVTRHTADLDWRARNPLRAWRVRTGTRAQTVATRLGVGKMSVLYWERGDRVPRASAWPHLARLTGTPNIASQWFAWLAERGAEAGAN